MIQHSLTSPEQLETLCESLFSTDSLVQIHRSLVELVSLKSELQRSQRFHTDRFCTLIKTGVGQQQQEPHNQRWTEAGQWLRQSFAAREIPANFTVVGALSIQAERSPVHRTPQFLKSGVSCMTN